MTALARATFLAPLAPCALRLNVGDCFMSKKMSGEMRRSFSRVVAWSPWVYAASIVGFYAVVASRTGVIGDDVRIAKDIANAPEDRSAWPFVSVIVPARNEERNIRACVTSLLDQEYPSYEVIAVDDASTDRTLDILRDIQHSHAHGARLRIEQAPDLPEGWAGKPHALATGVEVAQGSWVLFTDADTQHAPEALFTAVRLARQRHLDLLSFGTEQDLPDFWGRVLMPIAYMGVSMMYPTRAVNNPDSPVAIANGQYILLRRETYERIGGYSSETLRGTVLDDRDLAHEVKKVGGRIELVDGRDLVHTRMYQSLGEHVEGWGKNAYAGSRGGPLFFLLMLLGLPMTCIAPFALFVVGLLRRRRGTALAGGVAVGAVVAYRTSLNRQMGVPWRYVWTHALGAAIFTGILSRSFWRSVSGRGVSWRGRTYQIKP